jgi:virulence-associated protein VagC
MKTTRVFKSGISRAVRLPRESSVKGKIVEILRRGDEIVLREPGKGIGRAFEVLTELPDDFFATSEEGFFLSSLFPAFLKRLDACL